MFLDEAARHAWVPAVIGCGELGAEVWCREGNMTALELGDEAVVSVADFTLQGRAMRNVRQMVSRVCRQGYVAEIRRVEDILKAEIARLVRQADSWRGSPTERGFSMALGRVGGQDDGRCVLATATQDGVLRAVLHFVPWGSDGLSLDLMRRDRSAAPGVNDFLIVEAIKAASDLGVKRISLNFAVFRAALERGEQIGAGPVRVPGGDSCCSCRAGSRSSRCTSSTPSSARSGCRGSWSSPAPGTRRGSGSPRSRPRLSWSGRRSRSAGLPGNWAWASSGAGGRA